jgi:hypothetical protein
MKVSGGLEREGRPLYRFRLGDYRVYFEKHDLGVLIPPDSEPQYAQGFLLPLQHQYQYGRG